MERLAAEAKAEQM